MLTNKDLVKDNDIKIRNKSKDVLIPLSVEDRSLANHMMEYVVNSTNEELAEKYDLRPAVGISAIQVGVPKKILAIRFFDYIDDKEVEVKYLLANARVVSNSVRKCYLPNGEGCLSVDQEHQGLVIRSERIKVKAYDIINDKEVVISARGYLSIVFQHELDHFTGTLFYDHINKENPMHVPDNCIEI